MTATPTITAGEDEATGNSVYDGLKDNTLKAAGYAYLVGDAALFASGLMAGRYQEAATGLIWGLGGLAPARYGNPNAEKQLQLLSNRLGHYLRKEGIEIPKNPDTKLLTEEGGIIDHTESFLYKYPSQMLNAVFSLGGTQLLRSGLQHGKGWDAASGALVAAGGLAGLLIPEKKPDPEHPPTNMIGKAWAWLQEKPLRISGTLYALNNVTLTMSAIKEMRTNPAQKSYWFKFLTAGSYLFGNAMLAMSSKGHAGGNADQKMEAMEKLADVTAQVIAAQTPEIQEALVQHISGFLSAQPEVRLKAEEIAELLHKKLAKSIPATKWQQRIYDHPSPQATPSL